MKTDNYHIMRRILSFISIGVLTSLSSVAQGDAGKLKMDQGGIYTVQVQLNNTIAQQAMGQAINFTVAGTATHNYKVTNASDDFYSLHHEAQKITFQFDGMGTKKNFDSDNKKDINGEWGEPVRKILAKKYDLIMSSTGTVMKVNPESFPAEVVDDRLAIVFNMLKDLTSVSEPPKKGDASIFKILPEKPVVVGDTWTSQASTASEKTSTTYTLESIGDSTMTVSFKGNGTSQIKATLMGMETLTKINSVLSGTVILNKATGIIKEKSTVVESTGTMDLMGNSTPITSKSTIKLVVTPS